LLTGQALELIKQGRERLSALLRGGERKRWIAACERDREQCSKERRHDLNARGAHREHRLDAVKPPLGRIVRFQLRRSLELGDEGINGAVPVVGRALKRNRVCGSEAMRALSAAAMRDLPMPGSPETSTI